VKLGLELMASHPTPLHLGSFFETWTSTALGTLRRSFGRDEYHLSLTIDRGRRLAATGRTHICQLDLEAAELGVNQARPALLVPTDISPTCPLIWGIRTNLFLSLPALSEGATGVLLRDGAAPIPFAFQDRLLLVEEVNPGRYIVDVSSLLID
jgi:hypothetical protein